MRIPISVIVTTFNEAHNIADLMQSIDWVDEIIVVDSFSTDDTVALASQYTDQVFERAYIGPADQKNWAIPKAKNEWVLILDADERVTPELQKEMMEIVHENAGVDAYWINRQNFFLGKKVKYSGWQNDSVIRLIRRDKCRYDDKRVHEEIDSTGMEVGRLSNKLLHFTFKDAAHFVAKMDRYAKWSAEDHSQKVKSVNGFHLFFKPLFRFFKHYLLKGGILDGRIGFIISVLMAWGVFLRYLYLLESKFNSK